jgi:ribonuclease P protein component
MGLPAENRIRTRSDFVCVQNGGFRLSCGPFIFLCALREQGARSNVPRLGLVASRKVGNAVIRNRAKRRFRALFREHLKDLPSNSDCVVILRRGIHQFAFADLSLRFAKACLRCQQHFNLNHRSQDTCF